MADRTAAEVMCCPEGCEKDTMARLRGECHASAFVRLIESIHAAGFMIVPRVATKAMMMAALDRNYGDGLGDFYGGIYRAMTEAGELK